jgi:hypothetical protein
MKASGGNLDAEDGALEVLLLGVYMNPLRVKRHCTYYVVSRES